MNYQNIPQSPAAMPASMQAVLAPIVMPHVMPPPAPAPPLRFPSTGQLVPSNPNTWDAIASGLGLAGTALGAYHGYKRTGSVGWTIAWALLGGLFPIITIPVAYAQGFGQPDPAFKGARSTGA